MFDKLKARLAILKDRLKVVLVRSMLPFLVGVFLVVLIQNCGCAAGQHPLPTTSEPGIARLIIHNSDGSEGSCTAFKVGDGLIASAGHCVSEDPLATYTIDGGVGAEIRVTYFDRKMDVSIFRGPMGGDIIPLAPRDPGIGEPVWTRGYPHLTLVISDGYWSGRDADGQGICSVVVAGGASGSPVMDSQGRVVGVLVAGYRGGDNITLVSPIEDLRAAIIAARVIP